MRHKICKAPVLSAFAAVLPALLILWFLLPCDVLADSELYSVEIIGEFETDSTRQMLDAINDLRANDAWYWNEANTEKITVPGLAPLVYDYTLERIAMQRAAELAIYYSHTRPNGERSFTAYTDAFTYGTKAENIAYGYTSAEEVFTGWEETNEPYDGQGHRRNMLNANIRAVGIGCFACEGCLFWVQEFSSVVTNAAPDPLVSPVPVDILPANLDSFQLDPASFHMAPGQSASLSDIVLTAHDNHSPWLPVPCVTDPSAFSTTDPGIAATDDGLLTALAPGSTTLAYTVGNVTAEAPVTVEEIPTLTLGEPLDASLAEGQTKEFLFIPEETGDYHFYSTGNHDTIGTLYGESGNQLAYNDDGSNSYNFSLLCSLTAGNTYLLQVGTYRGMAADAFSICVEKAESFSYTVLSDGTAMITGCTLSGDIVIPAQIDGYTVSCLDRELFYGTSGITSVTIPATVTHFGNDPEDNGWDYVFSYCYDLENIYVEEGNPTFQSIDGVLYCRDGQQLVNYPCAHPGEAYHVTADILSCTSFASCRNLRYLFLDNADTIWYTYTFYNTGNLTVFYEPGGSTAAKAATEIQAGRVYDSDSTYCRLTESTEIRRLPADLTVIAAEAFRNTDMKYVIVPDGCGSIGAKAFAESSLEYIRIPEGADVADDAFGSGVVVERV